MPILFENDNTVSVCLHVIHLLRNCPLLISCFCPFTFVSLLKSKFMCLYVVKRNVTFRIEYIINYFFFLFLLFCTKNFVLSSVFLNRLPFFVFVCMGHHRFSLFVVTPVNFCVCINAFMKMDKWIICYVPFLFC